MLGQSLVDPLSLRYLQPLQNSNFKFKQCLRPSDEGYREIKALLFEIFKMIRQKDRHYELLLKSKLEELIYLLYFYRLVERKTSDDHYRKNEKIREIIDYINQHYAENLTIEKLSELMGYSKTHFMTIFKQHTGTSCTEFIIKQDSMLLARSFVIALNQFWKLLLMLVLITYPISTANLNTITIKHQASIENT